MRIHRTVYQSNSELLVRAQTREYGSILVLPFVFAWSQVWRDNRDSHDGRRVSDWTFRLVLVHISFQTFWLKPLPPLRAVKIGNTQVEFKFEGLLTPCKHVLFSLSCGCTQQCIGRVLDCWSKLKPNILAQSLSMPFCWRHRHLAGRVLRFLHVSARPCCC